MKKLLSLLVISLLVLNGCKKEEDDFTPDIVGTYAITHHMVVQGQVSPVYMDNVVLSRITTNMFQIDMKDGILFVGKDLFKAGNSYTFTMTSKSFVDNNVTFKYQEAKGTYSNGTINITYNGTATSGTSTVSFVHYINMMKK